MKKIFLTILATFAFINMAQAQMAGGFAGPGANSTANTVHEALKSNDNTPVVLRGNIIKSLGDEKYLFKDSTGEIIVDIDDEDWRGYTVTPDMTIEVNGEVDKEFLEATKIDVKYITVK